MKKNKYIFLFASVIASQFFVSCNNETIDTINAPIPYEKIGGYETSDDVAASSLVSKLSFENNLTDSKGAITGAVSTNVSYAPGKNGMAYDGSSSQHRYAVGNASTVITGLNDFTFSFWMNTANTVAPATPCQGKGAQGIFTVVNPTQFWGGLNVFLDNPDAANPNRILLKVDLENGRNGVVWHSQGITMFLDNSLNTWVHIVISYNSTTGKLTFYTNGDPSANVNRFPYAPAEGVIGSAQLYASDPGPADINNAPLYGVFQMVGTNGKIVFGTHQFDTNPPQNNGGPQDWATSYAGLLDEFRIYNAPLTANEVKALYLLEKDNR